MTRYASITQVKEDKLEAYKALHAEPWPGVLRMIEASHIRNYSIFWKQLPDGTHVLFSYFEYTGDNWEEDVQKMAADEETRRWWDVCKPCLTAVEALPEGEVWAPMQSVFYHP
ncbi:MAG: L-rhamnose mutarotase [Akkermansiaceae bacterium]|nr:L-rhamnose mutarotase [Akkermansiaceae bacterium]